MRWHMRRLYDARCCSSPFELVSWVHLSLPTDKNLGVLAGRQSGSSEASERLPAPVFSDSPSPVPQGPHSRRISVLEADDVSDDITSPILESSDLRSAVAAAQAREMHEIATGEASVHQTPEEPADVAAEHAAPDATHQASLHQAGSPESASEQATGGTIEHAAAAAAAGRVISVAGEADHSGSSAAGDEATSASNPVNEVPLADLADSDHAEAQPESTCELPPREHQATDVSEDTRDDGVQEAQPASASQPTEEGVSVGTGSAKANESPAPGLTPDSEDNGARLLSIAVPSSSCTSPTPAPAVLAGAARATPGMTVLPVAGAPTEHAEETPSMAAAASPFHTLASPLRPLDGLESPELSAHMSPGTPSQITLQPVAEATVPIVPARSPSMQEAQDGCLSPAVTELEGSSCEGATPASCASAGAVACIALADMTPATGIGTIPSTSSATAA